MLLSFHVCAVDCWDGRRRAVRPVVWGARIKEKAPFPEPFFIDDQTTWSDLPLRRTIKDAHDDNVRSVPLTTGRSPTSSTSFVLPDSDTYRPLTARKPDTISSLRMSCWRLANLHHTVSTRPKRPLIFPRFELRNLSQDMHFTTTYSFVSVKDTRRKICRRLAFTQQSSTRCSITSTNILVRG